MLRRWMKTIDKHKITIVVIIIFLILVVILTKSIQSSKSTTVNNKTFNIANKISKGFNNIRIKFVGNIEQTQIDKLQEENANLRKQLIENTIKKSDLEKLQKLEKTLKFVTNKNASSFISSSIVAKNSGTYYKSFTISAGSKDGVKNDSIVVNADGLIGRVYEVSDNFSKAISILDNRSPISFEIMGRTSDTGILSQDNNILKISDESMIKGYMFDANSNVKVGEIVTTSGLGLYPSGIPIGKIHQVIPDNQNILKYVVVTPFVDLKSIDKVIIFNKTNIES